MRFLKLCFFSKQPLLVPLEVPLILATFHGAIQVLKQLPGVRDTGELQIPGVQDAGESRVPGVPDARDSFFLLFFKLQANLPSVGTLGIRESPVSGTPGFGNPRCPGRRGVEDPWCPGHRGVVFECSRLFLKL